jgi:hypothetical protein
VIRGISSLLRPRGGAAPAPPEALAPFDAAARADWAWQQPHRWRPAWTLFAGEAPVMSLRIRGTFGVIAEGATASERWLVHRQLPGNLLVTRDGAAKDEWLARYSAGWFSGGRIDRTGRDALLWRRESFWTARYGIQTFDKLPLVRLQPHFSFMLARHEASIELQDGARRLPDLPVLLMLGWLLVLRSRRSHASYP